MITVEMDWDEVAITILDPEGKEEDLQVYLYDDVVYIRQWFEEIGRFQVIKVTPLMFQSLLTSMKLSEGAYILEKREKK